MNNKEFAQLINKYQGMINSNVFPILDKCRKLKESETDKNELEEIEAILNEVKNHEAKCIKLLNKYVNKLENN